MTGMTLGPPVTSLCPQLQPLLILGHDVITLWPPLATESHHTISQTTLLQAQGSAAGQKAPWIYGQKT
jgi:hypothetical protein